MRQGDASTQPHLEKYCGWVQTTYFDGITIAGADRTCLTLALFLPLARLLVCLPA
jgi:hypothetical protein